jgi:DNA polymerase III alpha subunit (gram-positive type)
MARRLVERRLIDVGDRLKRLRNELAVANEQLLHFADEADDARLRALVSETPVSERDFRDAQRHAELIRRSRDEMLAEIAALEKSQDELLDRLAIEGR